MRPPPSYGQTFGRIEGDVTLVAGPFVALGARAPRFGIDLGVRYASTVGVYGTFEDALGSSEPAPRRVVATGLEMRPLFLARWLTEKEFEKPRLDLTLDSLSLGLGAWWGFDPSPLGPPGLEARAEIGTPILATPTGPWIAARVTGRWSYGTLLGNTPVGPQDRALVVSIVLRWEQLVSLGLPEALQ